MLDFLKWFIGIGATVCAVPLLLFLGFFSLFGVIFTMKIETDTLLSFGGLIWCWAGFQGLFGYWRWMDIDIQGKELEEKDIERLINIRKQGIWGLLAFLPIAPALVWFAIPLLFFVRYIFKDIKQKLDTLRG
jgi:hypothetical protein